MSQLVGSGLLVTVNSDDAAYFGAYLTENYEWLAEVTALNVRQVAQLVANGFHASFVKPDGEERRRKWIDLVWQLALQAEVEAEVATVA